MSLRDMLLSMLSGGIALGPVVFAIFEYFNLGTSVPLRWKRVLVAVVAGALGVSA